MSLPMISDEQRRRLLVRRQFTDAVGASPVDVANNLVGLHSSDPVSVYLSLAARLEGLEVEDVDRTLYDQRSLIRYHAMRRTLWVMPPDLASIAHAATTSRYVQPERRRTAKLLDETLSEEVNDQWFEANYEIILDLLRSQGPMLTREMGKQLPDLSKRIEYGQGTNYAGSMSIHSRLVLHLGFEGRIVRGRSTGSWISSEYKWHLMREWAPGFSPSHDADRARSELVSLWLAAYGPGTETDIAWWTGLPLGIVRKAIASTDAVSVMFEDGGEGFALSHQLEPVENLGSSIALLPGLDPTTMGWKERSFYLKEPDSQYLFDRNGNGGPTVWVNGRIVGGWVQAKNGGVRVRLTQDVGREVELEIQKCADELERFWGETRFRVRFPAPIQRELFG